MNRLEKYETIKSLDVLFNLLSRGANILAKSEDGSLSDCTDCLKSEANFLIVAREVNNGTFLTPRPRVRYAKLASVISGLKILNPQTITAVVCKDYGVKFSAVISKNKGRALSEPRQILAVMLSFALKLGREKIGEILNMQHSEVTRSHKKINDLLEVDKVFEKRFRSLINTINQNPETV